MTTVSHTPFQYACPMCGKPDHGSLACEFAPGWPEPPKVGIISLDPSAPGGVYDRIAQALERIAASLEASNQESRDS